MPRERILGTAGHIDHGKTALVKALTGVDCDRLPEEKARGITIDIGFAALDLGEYRLGIVDVPGHERFVKNMLAGATGIDLAMLVVAADDSVMPQTREHLDILKLLGLRHGVIALTKCDLVDETAREVVALEVRDLVAGSFLENAPIVFTSATQGLGIEELRTALREVCRNLGDSDVDAMPFRMSIDRAFVMQGHGTVVTGSVSSGRLRLGDEIEWLPRQQQIRVRSLHHHDQSVDEVHRGMRAAINLAGVDHAEVIRGQELATPGYLMPTRTVSVRVVASADAKRSLKHRTPVRLHLGTAEVMSILALLDADALLPSEEGFGQLFLREAVTAVWGQPFVLRESSAATTLGGGRILQPVARKIRRHDADGLARLAALADKEDVSQRAHAAAWSHGAAGFVAADLVREAGIPPGKTDEIVASLIRDGRVAELTLAGHSRLIHTESLRELENRVLDVLAKLHAAQPLVTAHERSKVQAHLDYLGDDGLVAAIVDRLLNRKLLVGDGRRIARADFKPKLSANQRKLKDLIVAAHLSTGFQPPEPASFAGQAGGNAASLRDIFDVAVAEGLLVKISDDIFLHSDAEAEMRRRVRASLASGGLTVAAIRDLLNTSRKYAVPLCEYLDRVGVTRRAGDLRVAQESAAASE